MITALLLNLVPWGTLISLLFGYLANLYGKGFMGWILRLVAENAQKIDFGQLTKKEAKAQNVQLIQAATAQSPGINEGEAEFINLIAYWKWLSDNKPAEFKARVKRFLSGAGKLKSHSESDFMHLYTSRPDKPKPKGPGPGE